MSFTKCSIRLIGRSAVAVPITTSVSLRPSDRRSSARAPGAASKDAGSGPSGIRCCRSSATMPSMASAQSWRCWFVVHRSASGARQPPNAHSQNTRSTLNRTWQTIGARISRATMTPKG